MRIVRRPTWFATLRRDGALFACVAMAIMLLNVIQPVTTAYADDATGGVICTMYGLDDRADADNLPSAWPDECPICLAGHFSSSAPSAFVAILSAEPAHPAPAQIAAIGLQIPVQPLPALRAGDPPPAIRAPPASV